MELRGLLPVLSAFRHVRLCRRSGRESPVSYTHLDVYKRQWLDRAERWLKEGVFYAESLRNGRLRFSTVLPAWLGLDTLEDVYKRQMKRHAGALGRPMILKGLCP